MAAAAITWVPKPNVEVWPVDPPPPVNFNKTAEQEYGDKEVKLPHWTPTLHTFQVPQNHIGHPPCTHFRYPKTIPKLTVHTATPENTHFHIKDAKFDKP